jgi:hypothetical protein
VPTTAVDVLVACFGALADDEQAQALARLRELRSERAAGADSETAQHLAWLALAAERTGGELSAGLYRQARRELAAEGVAIPDVSVHQRHFGSWAQAREAYELSVTTSAAKVEARLRARLHGRPRSYRRDELEAALAACADALGRPPLVAEYEAWRQSAIDLARLAGRERFVPSAAPFRRRFGSFEAALVAFGYQPEDVHERYDDQR